MSGTSSPFPWQPPVPAPSGLPVPQWRVVYNGTDISANILPMVTQVHYQETLTGGAPIIGINVQDVDQNWQQSLYPKRGDTIALSIGYSGSALVDCGTFQVDQISSQGPPDTFTMHGIEAGIEDALRTRRNISYEGKTLVQIAQAVATRDGLTAITQPTTPDPVWKRVTQRMETDLFFLHRLAQENGYAFTIRNKQLVFYALTALLTQAAVGTITKLDGTQTRWAFSNRSLAEQTYNESLVTFFDPVSKTLKSGQASNPTEAAKEQFRVAHRVENSQQAAVKAVAAALQSAMQQVTGSIRMPGTMTFRAGNVVKISGFGLWDQDSYIVQSAAHELTADDGYTTNLTLWTVVQQSAQQPDATPVAAGPGAHSTGPTLFSIEQMMVPLNNPNGTEP